MIVNTSCRYINCNAICTLTGDYCTNCENEKKLYKYTYSYNPYNNSTRISIVNNRGHKYITCEIYGQLTPAAIKSYAIDLCKILLDKGVIK